jgi:hypothetical protein
MSLEQQIKELTQAIVELKHSVDDNTAAVASMLEQTPESHPPAGTASTATQTPMPGFSPTQTSTPSEPTQQPPAEKAPFTTPQEMVNYISQVYQDIGATHGAQLQQCMTELGVTNVNLLPAEKYDEFYAKVEAVKAAAHQGGAS